MAKIRTRSRSWLWLIRVIGVIVPRRLRADWREEWEAELNHREQLLAEWDRLDWRNKLNLLGAAPARFRMYCRYNYEGWRIKCFKTCVSAFECCSSTKA